MGALPMPFELLLLMAWVGPIAVVIAGYGLSVHERAGGLHKNDNPVQPKACA